MDEAAFEAAIRASRPHHHSTPRTHIDRGVRFVRMLQHSVNGPFSFGRSETLEGAAIPSTVSIGGRRPRGSPRDFR
jgi:hypothetical protein